MPVELKVPSVGESVTEVFIGQWLKNEGDRVEKDEPLVEVETDKATLEVPATASGVLSKIVKAQGDAANVGDVIAHIEEGAAAAAPKSGQKEEPKEEPKEERKEEPAQDAQKAPKEEQGGARKDDGGDAGGHVMPAAQRLMDEHGIAAAQVKGTGPGGRVLKEDVQRVVDEGGSGTNTDDKPKPSPSTPERTQSAPASTPKAPSASAGADREEEVVPMSTLRRRIAERLVQAQQGAALLTTFNEVDMSAIMNLRKEHQDEFVKRYGLKLGFMSFFVKATIDALKNIPQLNAEIRGTDIVYKNYYDVGVAVSTERGLLVPVVRNADRLSFAQIEETIADFGKRARDGKIKPDELQGGTFTISNGGIFGSMMSTPIVNPPQSGVLGMHAITERPVAENGQVVIRPMMYLALTYDHRIVDGREAVTFLKRIKDGIENPARMLLEV